MTVGGYNRSSGTYVLPHIRTSPNWTTTDNLNYRGYGTVRDYLLGLKVVLADGHLIRAGGKVVKVDDTYAEVELAPGMKVKALKSTITDVIPPGGAVAAND